METALTYFHAHVWGKQAAQLLRDPSPRGSRDLTLTSPPTQIPMPFPSAGSVVFRQLRREPARPNVRNSKVCGPSSRHKLAFVMPGRQPTRSDVTRAFLGPEPSCVRSRGKRLSHWPKVMQRSWSGCLGQFDLCCRQTVRQLAYDRASDLFRIRRRVPVNAVVDAIEKRIPVSGDGTAAGVPTLVVKAA